MVCAMKNEMDFIYSLISRKNEIHFIFIRYSADKVKTWLCPSLDESTSSPTFIR